MSGPVDAAALRDLCEWVRRALADGGPDVIVCDVTNLPEPDASTVEVIARLHLTARRLGRRIVVRGTTARLNELVALIGLAEVLPCDPVRRPEDVNQRASRDARRAR